MAIAPIPIPTIVTERLTLTPLTVADADGMVEVYADQRMHEFTGGAPPGLPQLRERYEQLVVGRNHDGSEQWCNWIVRLHGLSGVRSARCRRRSPTTSPRRRWPGRSASTIKAEVSPSEAACALVDWLLTSGVERITATIHPDHAASAGVAVRAGLVATDEVDDAEIVWHRVRDILA